MNIIRHFILFVAVVAAVFCAHAEPLKVGFYVGRGGRSNGGVTWARILSRTPEAEVVFLEGEDVRGGKLNGLDLLVMPGGDSSLQAKSLGEAGREAIRAYLRAGGVYFGTCAGCSIVQDKPGYLQLIPYRKTKTPRRGSGMIGTDFTEEGAKVLGLKPGVRPMTYHSGPLLEPTSPEAVPDCHDLKILATYAGSILESAKDPEPFPMQGRPAVISAGFGKGRLIVTSFHPEHYPLTRDVIAGAVRALTGRTLTLTMPDRPRGALRLGVYTPVVMGRKSYLPILELDQLSGVALQLVDGEFIDRGELDGLDALVVPDGDVKFLGDKKVLKGFRATAADAFVARGGKILSWGEMAARCPTGTCVCADGDGVVAAVRKMAVTEPRGGGIAGTVSVRLDNVAHRGLWVEAGVPQNTVEAIRAAYEAGAKIVETDFVETESGEMICIHDIKALASMSSIVIEPKKITPEDRARINLGEKAGLPRPYRIPLLSEVLAVVPKDAVLQAEIKVYGDGYARKFDAAVKAAGLSETNIIVSSFQEKALADFRRQYPAYRTLWLGCDIKKPGFDLDAVLAMARTDGFDIVCPGCEAAQKAGFTRQDADRIRAAGFGFRFYGVNTPEALRYAADMGAAGFTCNTFLKAYEWADELPDVELAPTLPGAESDLDLSGIFPPSVRCVSIVAPSSHADNRQVIRATNALARAGYRVKVMDSVWTYSADPAVRARDLERAWTDPETDLVLCARGGRGGFDTVKCLDFGLLASRDVPFVGFSNISTLMNAFLAKGVKRPISGPMCTKLGRSPTRRDVRERLAATLARAPLAPTRLKVLRAPNATVSGKPAGGHWPSISRMDPEWLPDTAGRIVFLEVNKTYTLESAKAAFRLLKDKGYFTNVAATVLCDLGIAGTRAERAALTAFLTEELSGPVFSGYPYGHIDGIYAIDYDRALSITPEGLMTWSD